MIFHKLTLVSFAAVLILSPHIVLADCKKIVLIEKEDNLIDEAKGDVFSEVFSSVLRDTPMVGIWSIARPKKMRNLVGRLHPDTPTLLLEKGDKDYKVRTLRPVNGRIIEGWVDKDYAKKPDWLDDKTLAKCQH